MVNRIYEYKWDEVEMLELYSNNYTAKIIPSLGGNIIKLSYNGEDILNTPKDLESYKNSQNNYGIPHLFPPNRIKGGKFEFNGREHKFPVRTSGNSLHGFLHFSDWKIEEKRIEGDFVSLTLSYTNNKRSDYSNYFPYKFRCIREYRLSSSGLVENYSVENLGDDLIPLSIGYHTAFPLKRGKDIKIKVSLGKSIPLGEEKIPKGGIKKLDTWEESVRSDGGSPNYKNLDNLYKTCDFSRKEYISHGAIIENNHSEGDIIYEVDKKYKYWVLCNYMRRGDIICIEPQSSSIDAHNRKDGNLIELEAKKSWSTTNKLYIKTREN